MRFRLAGVTTTGSSSSSSSSPSSSLESFDLCSASLSSSSSSLITTGNLDAPPRLNLRRGRLTTSSASLSSDCFLSDSSSDEDGDRLRFDDRSPRFASFPRVIFKSLSLSSSTVVASFCFDFTGSSSSSSDDIDTLRGLARPNSDPPFLPEDLVLAR